MHSVILISLLYSLSHASAYSSLQDKPNIRGFLQTSNSCSRNAFQEGYIGFPDDEGGHDHLKEWWYWTGQLLLDDGTHYTVEWLFEKIPLSDTHIFEIDFVLFGPDKNRYINLVQSRDFVYEKGKIALDFGDAQAYKEDNLYHVYGKIDQYSLNVTYTPTKAPMLYYGDGRADFFFGGYIDYYAIPRNDVQGTFTIGDKVHQVTGYGYYEHAYGQIDKLIRIGWDWFQINLDDGTDIIVAIVRMNYYVFTYDKDCNFSMYTRNQFKLEALDTWRSTKTGCQYATAWKLTFDDKEYLIEVLRDDMEFVEATFIKYVAALNVSGSGTGKGVMENVGVC